MKTLLAVLFAAFYLVSLTLGEVTFNSPLTSDVITTPDPLIVSIRQNGTNVPMASISLWRYDRWLYGTNEILQKVIDIPANNAGEYTIDLTNYPFSSFGCGDYVVKVRYEDAASGNGYSLATSGKIQILMDKPRFRINSPVALATWFRGQTYRISWQILSKPNLSFHPVIGLVTPDGTSFDEDSAFDFTGLAGTNTFVDWTIPTKTATDAGNQFSDGLYYLDMFDRQNLFETYIEFHIGTAPSPATLVWTNLSYPTRSGWQVSCQENYIWHLEESTDLIDWKQSIPTQLFRNGDFMPFHDDGNQKKFYRLVLVE